MKYIDLPIFILSLAVGLFYVYISGSDVKPVYMYPTMENMNTTQYKDNANNCYVYKMEEVACPTDPSEIESIPIQ
jgi:hypothetical protein